MVPEGERWSQCIANRTFKTRVIDLVLLRLPTLLLHNKPNRRLIVDYHQPVEYRFNTEGNQVMRDCLDDLPAMGEADLKFTRFADRFDKLLVDSIDGDSIPIALMHHEMCLRKASPPPLISVYRMELKLASEKAEDKKRASEKAEDKKPASEKAEDKKRKTPDTKQPYRTYEYVNIHALYEGLRETIAQSVGRVKMPSHEGHEISMLVSLIALTGTDFTRHLPQMSGKTVYSFLPDVWATLMLAYDPVRACLHVERARDYLVSLLYKSKFPRHVSGDSHASLKAVLSDLQGSGISVRIKESLPSMERIECTVRNANWLLSYWTCEPTVPDPIQAEYGFRLLPGGCTEYADELYRA